MSPLWYTRGRSSTSTRRRSTPERRLLALQARRGRVHDDIERSGVRERLKLMTRSARARETALERLRAQRPIREHEPARRARGAAVMLRAALLAPSTSTRRSSSVQPRFSVRSRRKPMPSVLSPWISPPGPNVSVHGAGLSAGPARVRRNAPPCADRDVHSAPAGREAAHGLLDRARLRSARR